MCWSSRTRSIGGTAFSRACSAALPLSARTTSSPAAAHWCDRISRFVALSSTIRIFLPDSPTALAAGTGHAAASARPSRNVNANVDPRPGSLSTRIEPPISSTSWRTIDKPRPVPPKRRVVLSSACENASNTRDCASCGMPTPVSLTSTPSTTSSMPGCASRTRTTTSPDGVNLIALPSRFVMICRRRSGSPATQAGTSGATMQASSRPFF